MDVVYAWDTKLYNKVYDNIDDIVRDINNGTIKSFKLVEKYVPGDRITSYLEQMANEKNREIIYTDDVHPFLYSDISISDCVMNTSFFNKHRDVIINALENQIRNSDSTYYTIPEYLYSDELLDYLLNKKDVTITIRDVDLSDEIIRKIKDKHIDAYLENNGIINQISSRYVLCFHTVEQLETADFIYMDTNYLGELDVNDLKYINSSCVIDFHYSRDRKDYYPKILDFIEKLNNTDKSHIVRIKVDKRSLFNKVFLDKEFNNVNIIVHNDLYDYSFKEYKDEEKRLDQIIEPLKGKELSPLERFLAIYNIVKNFKKYKENTNQKEESRYLRYILDNDYMVCVGFAKLLEVLCDKVGIDVKNLSVDVDTSYDDGFTIEEKEVEDSGHARCIVSMDDDKYNVHGLYVSDPTWDNQLDENRLNNVLMTFDKMDVSRRMFYYSIYSPILDIHNFKEFNEQINYLLKKEMKENRFIQNNTFEYKLLYAYNSVIERVLDNINCDPKYDYFTQKRITCKTEKDYEKLLTELGNYLLTRINQKVDENIIFEASTYAGKVIGQEKEIDKDKYYELDKLSFPYEIDNENDHNLIGRSK